MDTTLIVLLGIWIVMGLLLSLWANSIWKGYRPYGELVDHFAAIITAIIVGLGDWFILPLINIEGLVLFISAILEPAAAVLVVLWLLRKIKPQQEV